MARNQENLQQEYTNFVKELFHHVSKEITDFKRNIVSLRDFVRDIRVTTTQVHETSWATLEWMDKVTN